VPTKRTKKTVKKKASAKKGAATRKRTTSKKKATPRKATKRQAGAKAAKKAATPGGRKAAKARSARKSARGAATKASRQRSHAAASAVRSDSPASAPGAPVKAGRPLSSQDLAQFRDLLLAKRAELIGDVSTMQDEALNRSRQDAAGDLSNMPIHMADLGTDNYEQEFTLGLIEGERALLREIDEALARIANGTYGVCQATGKPIGKARLRARPWAKYCYEYVLAQERGQETGGL
jgi:RNA polymerase-binding protein DksA